VSKRIIRLDSSSLELSSCPRRFQFVNRQGLIPKLGEAPLDWGSALHKGIAKWAVQRARGQEPDLTKIADEAVEWYNGRLCLKNEPRSGANLRRCLMEYFTEYVDDQFVPLTTKSGEVAIELPFALPLYSNEHTDVLLTGKIDGIGIYQSGPLVIKDVKHSSSTKPESHMEEQLGRPQFHIYAEALKRLGLVDHERGGAHPRIVVDCVYISKQFQGAKFKRSAPTVIEPYIIAQTMEFVMLEARRVAELRDDEVWPHNYGACHGKYSKCKFYDLCTVPVQSQQIAINMLFDKREYNPKTFDE